MHNVANGSSSGVPHLFLPLLLCLDLLEGVCRHGERARDGWVPAVDCIHKLDAPANAPCRRQARTPGALTVDQSAGGLIHVVVALRQPAHPICERVRRQKGIKRGKQVDRKADHAEARLLRSHSHGADIIL
jgi:hypothetical protein